MSSPALAGDAKIIMPQLHHLERLEELPPAIAPGAPASDDPAPEQTSGITPAETYPTTEGQKP